MLSTGDGRRRHRRETPAKTALAQRTPAAVPLPLGTVTLLLADIEGSVRSWEADAAAMRAAIARYDTLVADAIRRHRGALPADQGEGDAFVAAFAAAADAVSCALDIQEALVDEPWPGAVELRVRMALHTGDVELRNARNYTAQVINRAARVRALAAGGQVLVTRATHDAVAGRLPAGATLRNLGVHRLRDMPQPEQVFQLCHPAMPSQFPPLRSPGAVCDTLPVPLTSFVGRQRELDEVVELLGGTRLLTLTGAGGCGKTRLALAAAPDVAPRFGAGVRFADLSTISDPALVPGAVAAAMELKGAEGECIVDALCEHVGNDAVLLVLDNCEHVVAVVAGVVARLLSRCPSARVLATSREQLRVSGETVWRVPSLTVPPAQDKPDGVERAEAVQLFVERARAALPSFALTAAARPAVAEICRRLDGIPLAIELAAPLVAVLPVDEVARRLADRFALLAGGVRHVQPRQRTLRAAVDWSYELLDEPEQALFVRLAVFAGGFDLAAAEAVAADVAPDLAVLPLLQALLAKSMVIGIDGPAGIIRYRLLETLRQYGLDRLRQQGLEEQLRSRHAALFATLAERADRELHGPGAAAWLARVQAELPNFRSALEWSFASGDVITGLRLVGGLRWYMARLGLLEEARAWLDLALRHRFELPQPLQLMALTASGTVAFSQGDYSRTSWFGDEGVALARRLEDRAQLAVALIVRGGAAVYEGNLERAVECFEESRELCASLEDRWGTGWLLTCWGVASRRAGRLDLAVEQLEEALSTFRFLGDDHGQILPLVNLALVAQQRKDWQEAAALCGRALSLAENLSDAQLTHVALCVLGRIRLGEGDLAEAQRHLLESLNLYGGCEHRLVVALALEGLAMIAGEEGRWEDGGVLWGFTEEFRRHSTLPLTGDRRRELDRYLTRGRAAVGADRLAAAMARGAALTLAGARAWARGTATR